MKSYVRSWALAALTVVAAVSSSRVDAAHIYNITPPSASQPSGWSVSGTIETPELGTQTNSVIDQWIFSITVSDGQTGYTFTDQDAGAHLSSGGLVATDASLYLNGSAQFGFAQNATNYLTWNVGPEFPSWKFERFDYPNDRLAEFFPSPLDGSVIGTIATVPEPSTYAMALAGLACGGWQMWRRRRLRQAPTLAA